MSCVEKRHTSHRVGSMLHHRFPNGFTDLFMDETDREVCTLTDRAFRSLCVGDDAVYNDDFLYGYSPFSCHKPLAGEPLKKTHHKDSKKLGQNKNDAQPWKQQQHKNITQMSSFLKAISSKEESYEGLLIKNGGMTDSNGESWDKSALRSIQKELSEFSDYHTSLTDRHYKNHHLNQSGEASSKKTVKNTAQPSGKSSKLKNGKSTVKLRKLNIKNFFLHSEFSPFQSWRDFNQFPFSHKETVTSILPIDNIPKWYDMPFYKELTEAHRKETEHTEGESCQKAAIEPPDLAAPKPIPPPPPPKTLPKPSATPAEKTCSSDGADGTAAPWRRNRSRAKSAIQANPPGILSQDNNLKTVEENLLLVKKESRSVDVKAVEEISSSTSTPFSICQLMTPLIPSRQPTETSEILSPSGLDLPLRPRSEAKAMPEPPVKRDSYKSLASSILFNLKDNRKRVKSRYSPSKFKILELPENGIKSPQSDNLKNSQAGSEGNASGLSTPADLKDLQTVCSPTLEPISTPAVCLTNQDAGRPLSDDYLLANLLQTKREAAGGSGAGEDNYISPFVHSKKNKNPRAKKLNYPSLHLYKKASPADGDMKYLQIPLSTRAPEHIDQPTEAHELSPYVLNRHVSPKGLPMNTGLSPNTSNVNKVQPPVTSPHAVKNERLSSDISVRQKPLNVPNKAKQLVKGSKEKDMAVQPTSREKDTSGQIMNTADVIRAAKEAINAAKTRALSAAQSESIRKSVADTEERQDKEKDEKTRNESTAVSKNMNVKPEPPPVPKRNFTKSDIKLALDKQQTNSLDNLNKGDLGDLRLEIAPKESEHVLNQGKLNHTFSAKQNNYIKYQRYAVVDDDDDEVEKYEEGDMNVNMNKEKDEKIMSPREMRDSENIINDLHALKELERVRLCDRTFENAKNKQGLIDIDEEARARNDLISRELRSIKKDMLSMRGNTLAKRELFAKKEKEQRMHEAFTKIDSNVIVNKALINDNYDRAKMALEEIISERQKRKNKLKEQEAIPIYEENGIEESCDARVQESKSALDNSTMEGKENSSTFIVKEDLKQRLGDLKDHNHMRQILSQTEPRFGDSHRSGGRIALPGMNKTGNEIDALFKTKHRSDKLTDDLNFESEEGNHFRHVERQVSQESEDSLVKDIGAKTLDMPAVPPRNKKSGESVTKETYAIDDDVFYKDGDYENGEERLKEMSVTSSEIQCGLPRKEPDQSESKSEQEMWDVVNNLISKSITATNTLPREPVIRSPEIRRNEKDANILQTELTPTREDTSENSKSKSQELCKLKRKVPSKPDHVKPLYHNNSNNPEAEDQLDKYYRPSEKTNVETDAVNEVPRNIISPLLLVNGVSVDQSPPDQASLSSKSSYFSVESALHRNTETGSNVYHSLENLVVVEDIDARIRNVSRNTKSDRTEGEYYSFSDHESEPDVVNKPLRFHHEEGEVQYNENNEVEHTTTDQSLTQDENNKTTMSPSNTFSPTVGIPALFKVKDNTLTSKSRKAVQPWSPRAGLSGLERREEELHQVKQNPEVQLANESITIDTDLIPADISKPKENLSNQVPPPSLSPSQLPNENPKKSQDGQFLTVPQEEDRFSGVSPSSEGLESFTTSTADTADEMGMNVGVLVEREVPKVPSERSGSTCSGNEGQIGLPKPPAVLPKSEKAILKAIKLANRRMKKEEAQKSSQKSSQSSSKHRAEKNKGDKPESKSSTSSRNGRSSDKKRKEKMEDGHHQSENDRREPLLHDKQGENHLCERTEISHKTDSGEANNHSEQSLPSVATERQGRSSDRHIPRKLDKRHYSSDRVISNVPVYKAHVGERPMSDRPFHRSQSTDRYLGDKLERKLSADMSANEKLDPRMQHIEKSIVDEFQQRGRARDKASRDNPLRRSHSIDAYSTEVPHPTPLSRQSSHTSQLSRQSSIEHTIVTQSFPMTQRKLLQDPDSGQYFFVDMPVQVKTKTFFDPETGSYVQLPVQPPDGAIPQASPMEVLTPPLVVYHGFVPVPLSPLARKTTIQAPHVEPEGFEQRRLERSRQTNCTDGHLYLEPIYSQHEHILGEFVGTEELDCPS